MFKRNNNAVIAAIMLAVLLLLLITVYATASVNEAMRVSARAAALYQPDTGRFIYSKNGKARLPMASTTKIMTALVAIERTDSLDEAVPIAEEAVGTEGSSAYLKEGDVVTMEELLYALLLGSANDAAVAIAYHIGGDVEGFAALMNEKAAELGLSDTHFVNPHGLDDEEHYTTAEDLARLGAAALSSETFREICSTYKKTIVTEERRRTYINHNKLLKLCDGAIGIKTGYTKRCGRCLVGAAERDGVTLVSVTLDAPRDWSDHEQMLEYGFDTFERVTLAEVYEYSYDLPVEGTEGKTVRVGNTDELSLIVEKGEHRREVTVDLPESVPLPVKEGDALGEVRFTLDGEDVGGVRLVAMESAEEEKRGFFDFLKGLFK
ncbi:MAG: D-alanyl-D-alanine carboxypeptidase [Clostridia bacterium]|nr:D-alanyl-D-alanine carboxypeptidase [Clostridia bacterium]